MGHVTSTLAVITLPRTFTRPVDLVYSYKSRTKRVKLDLFEASVLSRSIKRYLLPPLFICKETAVTKQLLDSRPQLF